MRHVDPSIERAKTRAVLEIEERLTAQIEEMVAPIGHPLTPPRQEQARKIVDEEVERFNARPLEERVQFAADWLSGIPGTTTDGLADAMMRAKGFDMTLDIQFDKPIERVDVCMTIEQHDPRPPIDDDPQEADDV
jgi:hypothetical protein